jgi:hypothetical protein
MLIFFNEIAHFGKRPFLYTDEDEINNLVDVNIVDVTDEFLLLEFVCEQAEEKEEDRLSVGSQTNDL